MANAPYSVNKIARRFTVTSNISESTAASTITVQSNGNSNKTTKFISCFLSSAVATNFVLQRGGTLATATAATINQLNPTLTDAQSSVNFAYTASNISSPITFWAINLAAGIPFEINLEQMGIVFPSGIKDALTVASNAVSGLVGITLIWEEN